MAFVQKRRLLSLVILGILTLNACSAVPTETAIKPEVIATPSGDSIIWIPKPGLSFQIQFSGELDLSVNADVFELDVFDIDASVIQQLHQSGKHVICYLNAGAVEDWRPDADKYPPQLVGKAYQGWPGENWLDIRSVNELAPLLESRLDLCRSKGFDGVEFDNVDGYQNDTGFDLTASDQLTFNRWLADAAHQRGLAVGLKNDPEQITDLEPWFDFLILESCFDQGWCDMAEPFAKAGKLVIDIEYKDIKPYCNHANDLIITLIGKDRELSDKFTICS